jgi:hypothetical protein
MSSTRIPKGTPSRVSLSFEASIMSFGLFIWSIEVSKKLTRDRKGIEIKSHKCFSSRHCGGKTSQAISTKFEHANLEVNKINAARSGCLLDWYMWPLKFVITNDFAWRSLWLETIGLHKYDAACDADTDKSQQCEHACTKGIERLLIQSPLCKPKTPRQKLKLRHHLGIKPSFV